MGAAGCSRPLPDRPQIQWTLHQTDHTQVLRWNLGPAVHCFVTELESAGCGDTSLAKFMRKNKTRTKSLFVCAACAHHYGMNVVALAKAQPVPWVTPEQGPKKLATRHTNTCPHLQPGSDARVKCLRCGVGFDSARAASQHRCATRCATSQPVQAPPQVLHNVRGEAARAASRVHACELLSFRAQNQPSERAMPTPVPRLPRQPHIAVTHSTAAVVDAHAIPGPDSPGRPLPYTYRTVLAPRPTDLWLQKATTEPFRSCETRARYRTALMGPTIWVGLVAAPLPGPANAPWDVLPLVLPECCPWAPSQAGPPAAHTGCQIFPCKNRLSREIPVATVDGFRLVKFTEFLCQTHRPSQDATFNWCSRGVRVPAQPDPAGSDGVVFHWEGLEVATASRYADTAAPPVPDDDARAASPAAAPATDGLSAPAQSRTGPRGLFWDARLFRWLVHMFRAIPCATQVARILHMQWDHRLNERRAVFIRQVRAGARPLVDATAVATEVLLYLHELHHQLQCNFVMDLIWYWWCEEGQDEYLQFMARCQRAPDVQTHVGHDVTYKCCKGAGVAAARTNTPGTSAATKPEWVSLKAYMLTVVSHTGLVLHTAPVPDEGDRAVLDAYTELWKVAAVALSEAGIHALPRPTDQQATEETLPRLVFTDKARADAAHGGTKFATTLEAALAEAWPELPPDSRATLVQRLTVVQDIWHAIQRMKGALPRRHPMFRRCLASYRDLLNACKRLEYSGTADLYETWVPKLQRQITAWEDSYRTPDVTNNARGKGRLFEWGEFSRALGTQPASVFLSAAGVPVEDPGVATLDATIREARDELMSMLSECRDAAQVQAQCHGPRIDHGESSSSSSDSETGQSDLLSRMLHGLSDSSDSDASLCSADDTATARACEPALCRTRSGTRASGARTQAASSAELPIRPSAGPGPPERAPFQVNADEAEEDAVDAYLERAAVEGAWLLGPTDRPKVRQQVRNVTADTTLRALVANATCDWDAACGTQKNERFHKELNTRLRAVAGRRGIPLLQMTACVVAWGWNLRHLPRVLARGVRVKGRSNRRQSRQQQWSSDIAAAFAAAAEGRDMDRPHSHLLQIQTRWQIPHPRIPHLTELQNGRFASDLITYCNGEPKQFPRKHARRYAWSREEVEVVRSALSSGEFMSDVERDNPFQALAHERLANGPSEAQVRRLVYAIASEARLREDRTRASRA